MKRRLLRERQGEKASMFWADPPVAQNGGGGVGEETSPMRTLFTNCE